MRTTKNPAMTPWTRRSLRSIALGLALGSASMALAQSAPIGAPLTGAAAMQPAAPPGVNISNFSFQPALLEVTTGTRVTWTNHDSTPHTVTSTDKRFDSSSGLDTNDQYSYVFDKPGTYEYFCSLHPMMVGKVVVSAR
jgi:plastocyanin